MNAKELRQFFMYKGFSDLQFEEVPQEQYKDIFGAGTHFITGPVFRSKSGNIYDSEGEIVYFTGTSEDRRYPRYVKCGQYVGTFQYVDRYGFPLYRFPGGTRYVDDYELNNGSNDRKEIEA